MSIEKKNKDMSIPKPQVVGSIPTGGATLIALSLDWGTAYAILCGTIESWHQKSNGDTAKIFGLDTQMPSVHAT
jgi:hypothetical protein